MELRYEIVRILDAANLIDCESYQRSYRTRDGTALIGGHYVVLWDESVETPGFDENATYVGPYKTSLLASLMLRDFLRSLPMEGAAPADQERRLADIRADSGSGWLVTSAVEKEARL